MSDFGQLVVQLELQQAQFAKGMNEAAKRLETISKSAKKSQSGLDQLSAGFAKLKAAAVAAAGAFAGFKGLESVVKATDTLANLTGSFKALTGDSSRAADMMERVFGVVGRTGAPLEAVGGSMQRLTIAMKDLGASNAQIEKVAETFIQLGKVGGSSAAETAAGLQQLGQALASGKLGGDELRSIRENVPMVAQAIAEGIGVTTGQLKQLGEDGKLTADVVANALIAASGKASAAFANMPVTFEQALNKMEAQATLFGAALDKTSGISTAFQSTTDFITTNLKRWTDELEKGNNKYSLINLAATALKLAIEATLVIFTDVLFTVEAIARSLAAAAVEAFNLVTMNWSKLGEAWQEAEEQTARARKELDAYHAAVLGLQKTLAAGATSLGVGFGTGTASPQTAATQFKPLSAPPGAGGGSGEDKAKKELEALQKRAEAIAASVDPAVQYNQTMKELNELLEKNLLSFDHWLAAKRQAQETRDAEVNALLDSIEPMRVYERELEKINQLYMAGRIEVEQWVKAKEKLDEKFGKGDTETKLKSLKEMGEELGDTLKTAGSEFFADIISGSATAEEAFKKFAQTVLQKIAEMVAAAAAAWIVKSLFGGATGGAAGASAPGSGEIARAASASMARLAANTNLATMGSPALREGSGATTTAGNTISGNQRPELKVVVNNNTDATVSTRQNDSGDLEITIDRVRRALSSDMRRGGNLFADSLERSFTVARRGA